MAEAAVDQADAITPAFEADNRNHALVEPIS
jgi:hypothetical protein